TVIDQIKGVKVIHFVRRRRKHRSKRTKGHRQQLTLLRITDILANGADATGVKAAIGASSAGAMAAAASVSVSLSASAKKPVKEKAEAKVDVAAGADDLKILSGIGPALEKKLHEAGVTSFAQIAAWGADDIADMDEKLSFKGRIEREGWVAQAVELAKG
ncbi:MAG: bL21 family ribosomal protein, partial [Rhodobacteraceae bacterium]|nr:bL21 family ribosomal protein [Paracoccaceae bacterium]